MLATTPVSSTCPAREPPAVMLRLQLSRCWKLSGLHGFVSRHQGCCDFERVLLVRTSQGS